MQNDPCSYIDVEWYIEPLTLIIIYYLSSSDQDLDQDLDKENSQHLDQEPDQDSNPDLDPDTDLAQDPDQDFICLLYTVFLIIIYYL